MHNKEELENIVPSKAILKQIWEHSTHQGKIVAQNRANFINKKKSSDLER